MTVTDPVFESHHFEPSARSVFGPIVSAFDVEHALVSCVRTWIRDYLAEMERQRHMVVGELPEFRSIVTAGDSEKFPEDQLPSLMIASPGIETRQGAIEVHGDGAYVARWRVECSCEVSARGNRLALALCRLYAAAVRALLVQQALDQRWYESASALVLRRIDWTGEISTVRDSTSDRTRAASKTLLLVEVAEVTNRQMGPLDPLYPPTDPDKPPEEMLTPDAERAVVDVIKQERE